MTIHGKLTYKDGKIYGFPFQSVQGFVGWVYNKDVFEKYGIQEPNNWNEFLQVCETLKENGVTPIHYCKDTWVPQIFMSAGFSKALGDAQTQLGRDLIANKVKWADQKELVGVIDAYLSLFNKGYVNDDFLSVSYDDSIAAVADGTAAMAYNGDWYANSVIEANPNAKVGMFNIFLPNEAADVAVVVPNSIGFAINKNSEKVETAKKIFELFSTPEYGNLWFKGRPGFSAFKEINSGETPSYLETLDKKYVKTGKFLGEFNGQVVECKPALIDAIWVYYLEAASKKNMDGKALLEKFQGDFDKYMKENQYPGF